VDAGGPILDIGYSILDIGYSRLDTGCRANASLLWINPFDKI
jgi:hypothetical protein